MGKAKFLLALAGILPLGIGGYAAARDECSYAPGGAFDLRLAFEGIRHQISEDAECDPWAVIEPDRKTGSVTIVPYSNWTDAPSLPVTINADGTIIISQPLDRDGAATRVVRTITEPILAARALDDLQRFTRFNRFTLQDPDRFVEGLSDDADLTEARTYMVAPTTWCWGKLHDGGGVRLEFVDGQGRRRMSVFDSYCNSPAMRQAIGTTWDIREQAFQRARFTGEHFADNLARF